VTLAIAARHTHFRHRYKIFKIKRPINSQFSHQFWYFPLLKHDIIPKKNKQTNVFTLNFIIGHQKVTNSIRQDITLKTCITKVILPIPVSIIYYVHSRLKWRSYFKQLPNIMFIMFNLCCNCSFFSVKRLETCILTFIYLIKQLLNRKK